MASNSITKDHHSLRRNLKTNGNYISGDGDDEGLQVNNDGDVLVSGLVDTVDVGLHDHSLGAGMGAGVDHTDLSNVGSNTHAQIDTAVTASTDHIAEGTNPHGITLTQTHIIMDGDLILDKLYSQPGSVPEGRLIVTQIGRSPVYKLQVYMNGAWRAITLL